MTVNTAFASLYGNGLLGDDLPTPETDPTQLTGLLPAPPPQPILAGVLGVPVDPGSIFAPPANPRYGLGGSPQPQGMLGLSGLNSVNPFAAQMDALQSIRDRLSTASPLAQFGDPLNYAMATLPGQSDLWNAPMGGFAGTAGQGDLTAPAGVSAFESGSGRLGSEPATNSGSSQGNTGQSAFMSGMGLPGQAPTAVQRPASVLPAARPNPTLSANQQSVADQITGAPAVQKLSPLDRSTLAVIAYSESRLDPNAHRGTVSGLFQFQGPTFKSAGGTDITDSGQQIAAAANLLASDKVALSNALHAAPTPAQLYMAHMQGRNGSIALLTAPPGQTAVDALVNAGVDPVHARRSIIENGGQADMSASDFVNGWNDRFNSYFSLLFPPPGTGAATPRTSPNSSSPPSVQRGR